MFAAEWIVACALIGQVGGFRAPVAKPRFTGAAAQVTGLASPAKVTPEAAITVHGERLEGTVGGYEDGQLTIATEPPQKVALDDLERIDFVPKVQSGEGPPGAMNLVWVGQDNHDLAQASTLAGRNGIQDIHLQCRSVPLGRRLKQVLIFASKPGSETKIWAIDPETSNFWRVVCVQAVGDTTVNLFFEPPAGDGFDLQWEAWLTTDDNQTVKAHVRASTHTDNTLPVGAEGAAPAPLAEAVPGLASVLIEGDETIRGEVVGLDEDSLLLKTAWEDELTIPLIQVRACWMGGKRPEMLAAKLGKRGEADWVLFKSREEAPAAIDGTLKGLADGKFELTVAGESRKVAADRLMGFVLAARPPQARPATFYQVFELRDGQKISGRLKSVTSGTVELRTLWDAVLRVPRPQLKTVTCHNGKMTYLSDLEPAAVDEASYFGRPRPYRRDQSLEGGPLSVKGVAYRKGLAVHSRSVLSYALDGRFATFQATLGFDDAAPPGGSVACRVLADDRELYANPKLRQTGDAVPLKLSVEGVKLLVLEIEFGEGEDIGDRVVWAGARLLRERPNVKDNQAKDEKPVSSDAKE